MDERLLLIKLYVHMTNAMLQIELLILEKDKLLLLQDGMVLLFLMILEKQLQN
jgi:hypothetical protein